MVRFDCPSCKTPVQADDKAVGKRAKCRKCGATVTVPTSETFLVRERPAAEAGKFDAVPVGRNKGWSGMEHGFVTVFLLLLALGFLSVGAASCNPDWTRGENRFPDDYAPSAAANATEHIQRRLDSGLDGMMCVNAGMLCLVLLGLQRVCVAVRQLQGDVNAIAARRGP